MANSGFFQLKRIFFDRIFKGSYWIWRRHPAIIIPSMLGTAISVIEQSIVTTALIALLVNLAMRGLLPTFLSQLGRIGGIANLFGSPVYGPALILLTAVALMGVIIVAVIGGGFVYSSEYGVYVQAWRTDRVPIASVVENGSRNWKRMAWTLFLSNLITWGPAALVYSLLFLSSLGASSLNGLVAVFITSQLAYPALAASLILAIFTVYSYPAVVVDGTSGLRAVKNSFGTASRNFGVTLTYCLVRVLFQIILTLTVLLTSYISIPLSALSAALLSLLFTPILHSTKTMIYYQANPNIPEMPFQLFNPIWHDVFSHLPTAAWLKIRAGLVEAGRFAVGPKNLTFHMLSALAFVVGIFAGSFASTNGIAGWLLIQGYVPGRGNPILNQVAQRPALGIDIFLNNWLVSIATGLAGIGFAAPSFTTILFNGFILGVILPISSNLAMFLAAILPHGIIEIPSFILAGSMGIKLGYAAWRSLLGGGPESNDYLSRTLRQAVYVVIGLAPLFLVAGLIEADVTPIIMKMFGWTF